MKPNLLYIALSFFLGMIIPRSSFSQNQQLADSLIATNLSDLSSKDKWIIYQDIAFNSTSPKQKLEYSEKALAEAQSDEEKASSFIGIAQAYRLNGNLTESLAYGLKAMKIFQELKDKKNIAIAANTLSTTYLEVPDYEKAKYYIRRSIQINKEHNNSINLAGDYNNLGETFRLEGILDSALVYFTKARQLYDDTGLEVGIAYATGNIGLVLAEQGNFYEAEQKIAEAKEILTKLNDYYPIVVYNQYLAEIYQTKYQPNRAIKQGEAAYAMAKEQGLKAQVRDLSKFLAQLHEEQENYKNAHFYQKEFMLYKDSVMNEDAIRKMAKLQSDYELGLKQAEIDLLNKEKTFQNALLGGSIVIILLCLLLAFIWYRSSREKLQANSLLVQQTHELQEQRDQLEVLNNSRNKFFSIISHDLRGPVNAFDGISRLMEYYAAQGDFSAVKESVQHLTNSAQQLSRLLDNLLGWSLSQQGKFPFKPEAVPLSPLCQEIMQVFESMAHSKGIRLYTDIPKDLQLYGDYNSVSTILRNLVSNALKFTEEGGKVGIAARQQDDRVHIRVIDNGIGIPEKRLQKLLQLRDEKRTYGTAGEKGLGLGLQLAFEFTHKNKGQLQVDSSEGKGTTFTLSLPLFRPEEVSEPAQ